MRGDGITCVLFFAVFTLSTAFGENIGDMQCVSVYMLLSSSVVCFLSGQTVDTHPRFFLDKFLNLFIKKPVFNLSPRTSSTTISYIN